MGLRFSLGSLASFQDKKASNFCDRKPNVQLVLGEALQYRCVSWAVKSQ